MESLMSKQYQTTIPSEVRKKLGIKPGNQLNWKVTKNKLGVEYAIVTPETKSNLASLKGIAKKMYEKNKDYLNKERSSWT